MKEKTTTTIKNLGSLIPKEQLSLSKTQLRGVIKGTESNELHITYTKMKGFMDVFISEVKNEFVKRAKRLKQRGKRLSTDIGIIVYNERHNYIYDEDKINAFLKKHKISPDEVYDYKYALVTKNQKVLDSLESKGFIAKSNKFNVNKVERLAEKFPKILDFIKDNPTEFVKGL